MITAMAGYRAPIFGIGRFPQGSRIVDFEIGWPEFARDVAWARRLLGTWSIAAGDHVVLTTPNYEGPWTSPLIRVVRELGAVHSNAEPYTWDARRAATFLKLLPVRALIGLSGEAATALLASAESVVSLGAVPLVWARVDAVLPLRDAGLRPAALAMLGPALAAECPQRAGLHLDPAEWQPGVGPAGLTLTTVGDRAYRAQDLPLGFTGQLTHAPCPCGLPGPRIQLDTLR